MYDLYEEILLIVRCAVFSALIRYIFFTSKLIVNHWFNGLLMFFADVISDINVD